MYVLERVADWMALGWFCSCLQLGNEQVVHEKHILTIMYISVLEWVCTKSPERWCDRQRLFPNVVDCEALRLEVAQLKKKFDAMSWEYGASVDKRGKDEEGE